MTTRVRCLPKSIQRLVLVAFLLVFGCPVCAKKHTREVVAFQKAYAVKAQKDEDLTPLIKPIELFRVGMAVGFGCTNNKALKCTSK